MLSDEARIAIFKCIRFDHASEEKIASLNIGFAIPDSILQPAIERRQNRQDEDPKEAPRRYAKFSELQRAEKRKVLQHALEQKKEHAAQMDPNKEQERELLGESLSLGEKPVRNIRTAGIVKCDADNKYYKIAIHYVEQGDKYEVSISDTIRRKIICSKQEIPRSYVLFGVPVEDLEHPEDILECLKKRLMDQIKEEGDRMQPDGPETIAKEFFMRPQRSKTFNSSGEVNPKAVLARAPTFSATPGATINVEPLSHKRPTSSVLDDSLASKYQRQPMPQHRQMESPFQN